MSDWKGAGVDNLQIYWWKHFSFTHNRLSTYFSEILNPIQAGGGGGDCAPLQVFPYLCLNGLQWADETF